jgi:MFS family permease
MLISHPTGWAGPAPSGHPRVPGREPSRRRRARAAPGAYVSVGVAAIALFGAFLFLTYYLQTIKGYSPITAGLAFLPMVAGLLMSANLSSTVLLPRVGPRALIATGMLLGTGAMAYLTQISVTSSYASSVLPALLALGLGFGMILPPAINTATAGVHPQDTGVASALVNTMQQVGGSIGAAALSTLALTATAHYLLSHHTGALAPATAATHGYTVAFTTAAALFGLGVLLAIVLLPAKARLEQLRQAASTPGSTPAGAAPDQAGATRPVS